MLLKLTLFLIIKNHINLVNEILILILFSIGRKH